ncbi:MAG: GIY-YIG nuclease family protein [Candidatus Staskawiczbacteria bacterium]|jgi:putative endonuclease
MYSVYILQSLKDNKTYTGFSENAHARLIEHNSGKVDATKNRRPLKILFIEEAECLSIAKKREKYWKSGAGRRKLKIFFEKGFPPI